MKNPNQTIDKQKVVASPIGTQALQVIAGAPPPPGATGSAPAALPQSSLPPRVMGPATAPPPSPGSKHVFRYFQGGAVTDLTRSHPTDSCGCPARARAHSSPSTINPTT
ncbi:UNVERIFIED_CONTAM: hypothetical protein Sradi_3621900 [Sesamum radiatum]|uniref:Uncharacterized protein n=1 Tax=Sesamum radiatum TaxID=300843 RepID=A0AAW2QHN5_SESRA